MRFGWIRRAWPAVIVGALLAAVAALSTLSRPTVKALQPGSGGRKPPDLKVLPSVNSSHPFNLSRPDSGPLLGEGLSKFLSHVLVIAFAVITLIVLVWLILYILSAFRTKTAHRQAVPPTGAAFNRRDEVLAAVDRTIAELAEDDSDPRSAVIMCWVRLEEIAGLAGTDRGAGDTSSELVQRLLGDHQVSSGVLLSLADLYRRARYSRESIDSSMRTDAVRSLERLREELRHSRSGPLADTPIRDESERGVVALAPRRPRPSPGGDGPL
jgi:hypothetical protein